MNKTVIIAAFLAALNSQAVPTIQAQFNQDSSGIDLDVTANPLTQLYWFIDDVNVGHNGGFGFTDFSVGDFYAGVELSVGSHSITFLTNSNEPNGIPFNFTIVEEGGNSSSSTGGSEGVPDSGSMLGMLSMAVGSLIYLKRR